MDEYKRRRRRSRAVMSMFLDSLGGSIDNVDVATFDSDGTDLKALVVGIEPIQDLNGYDNPWPAGGGKNKGRFASAVTDNSRTQNGCTSTPVVGEKAIVHISGTVVGGTYYLTQAQSFAEEVADNKFLPAGTYTVSTNFPRTSGGVNAYLYITGHYTDGTLISSNIASSVYDGNPVTFTLTDDAYYNIQISCPVGYSFGDDGIDVWSQIESGSTATAWTPYANICPISGHSSVNVIVSPTLNLLDGTITNIPLGGTYYGGQLDVLTGVLTVTHANITSYNGETINEPWISSMDAYSSGATPTTGAQVVYPLATPQTIQLTGQQIATFLGTNNVWCDSGKIIHLEY